MEESMKKNLYRIVALLCVFAILLTACGSQSTKKGKEKGKDNTESAEGDTQKYKLTDQDVSDLEAIRDCTDEIARLMKEGTQNVGDFSDSSDYKTCLDVYRSCDEIYDDLVKIESKLKKLGSSDTEYVQNACDSALVLVSDAERLMLDTSSLYNYVYGVLDAFYTIDDSDFDVNSSTDIADLYEKIDGYASAFTDDTDVPDYLKDSHKNLSKYFTYMNDVMYEYYIAMLLMERTKTVDYLRMSSAELEMQRVTLEFDKGMSYWLNDFDDEIASIDRRYDNILKFNKELNDSIDAVLEGEPAKDISRINYEKEVVITYDCIDVIYPALYNREDYLVHLSAYSDYVDTEVVVTVEVEGFTQEYSQKMTLTDSMTELYIHPPVLSGEINLASAKEAQVVVSVVDAKDSSVYLKESQPVKIMSKNDVNLYDPEYGDATIHNFLALMTPEAPELDSIKRDAITILEDSGLNPALIGYQGNYESLIYEVYAILWAIGDAGVRYDTTSFSYSDANSANQRVKFPVEVLEKKSGLCVETSALLASILKSMNVHCFLIFPPGHCQVAVELEQNSGQYLLVETTVLPASDHDINELMAILDDKEWSYYISNQDCLVVDCDMAIALNFQTLYN